MSAETVPLSIDVSRADGMVTIEWNDGHTSAYVAHSLRWACPCAECQGEWGRPGRLSGISELVDDETVLTDVQAVGMYALMPVWASGHHTGIYSWDYLRSICPCLICKNDCSTP